MAKLLYQFKLAIKVQKELHKFHVLGTKCGHFDWRKHNQEMAHKPLNSLERTTLLFLPPPRAPSPLAAHAPTVHTHPDCTSSSPPATAAVVISKGGTSAAPTGR
jgi:hypothetical protein